VVGFFEGALLGGDYYKNICENFFTMHSATLHAVTYRFINTLILSVALVVSNSGISLVAGLVRVTIN
jgi:hypothetical protein